MDHIRALRAVIHGHREPEAACRTTTSDMDSNLRPLIMGLRSFWWSDQDGAKGTKRFALFIYLFIYQTWFTILVVFLFMHFVPLSDIVSHIY